MGRILLVLVLALLTSTRVLAQAEIVSLRELGGDEAALRGALSAGKSVDLAGLTVEITSALMFPANQTLFNGAIDASAVSSGAAIIITNGPRAGGMPSWRALDRVTIRVHPSPARGTHSTTTDGILFSGMNIAVTNVTIQGARSAWTFDSNTWSIQINDSMAWYNGEGLTCSEPRGGGAGIRLTHVEFAHNDYALYNNLCEITVNDGSFDSAVLGYIRDNITSAGGSHNSLFVCNQCRFESGGSATTPWIKNSGYMTLNDPLFYEGVGACSALIDNRGDLEVRGGFSRLRSDEIPSGGCGQTRFYSSVNSGRMTVRGIRPRDVDAAPLRFTAQTSRVRNGDVEDSTLGFAGTPGTLSADPVDPHEGSYSLKYQGASTASTLRSSAISVSSGAGSYQFTLYYKNRNAAAMMQAYLQFFDATGVKVDEASQVLANTSSWQLARWRGAVPPNAAYARFYMSLDTKNSGPSTVVHLDDLYYTDW